MPGRDGTGPQGFGALTGGGFGNCPGSRSRGMGGFGGGYGRGRGRGRGYGYAANYPQNPQNEELRDQVAALTDQVKQLQQQLQQED